MDGLVELTEFLVKKLVSNPEEAIVEGTMDNNDIIISINVSDKDMASVIGRAGKTANSIRTIVQASAYLHNLGRVKVNINTK